jgi:hypothetical protein
MNGSAHRLVTLALVLTLTPVPTFAQTLRAAAKAGGAELAAAQRPAVRGSNPYKTPAIVLMSAGAGLTLSGLAAQTTVCAETCRSHPNKGVLFGGLGTLGVGAFLYMKGENRRAAIRPVSGGIVVSTRIRF